MVYQFTDFKRILRKIKINAKDCEPKLDQQRSQAFNAKYL